MSLQTNINYNALITAVRNEVIAEYQYGNYLGFFPSVQIPQGIAAEKWAQKYMLETKRAGVHERGFNPNSITLDFKGFQITPVTIDQKMILNEIDQAQFQVTGMFDKIVPTLGQNLKHSANMYIFQMCDGNGDAPSFRNAPEFHYLLASGNGDGTPLRPNWLYDEGSAGAWSTTANMFNDIAKLKGNFVAKGGNIDAAKLLLPRCAAPALEKVRSEFQNMTARDYLESKHGLSIEMIDDEFFVTSDLSTAPTLTSFDMVLIDTSEFIIGYQRPEKVTVHAPQGINRDMTVEAEVWFSFLCVPFRKNEGGTIKTYKACARVKGINGA